MQHKILLTALLAVFLCTQNVFAETEPNDSQAQANTLAQNSTNSGKIDPAGDVDWWKITTTGDGKLDLSLTPLSGKFVWIYLFDNDGTTLINSTYSNAAFSLSTDGLGAGTYYIRVNCFYGTDTCSYTISNAVTLATPANDAEPNGTKAQAKVLPLNSSKTGHVNYYYNNQKDSADWYKITLNQDGRLKLSLTPANGRFTWIYLFDNDGTTLINSSYSNAAFDQVTDGLGAGTYYIKINTYYYYDFAPYTLADTLYSPAESNDTEPNGTAAQALTFALNSTAAGHVNYYYNNQKDSSDWYKITLNQDGRLKLSLTPGNGRFLWIYLYDNDGTTLINSSYSNGAFDQYTDGLGAGTYYVKINTYYYYDFAPYTFSNSLTPYINANDTEPNKQPYQAKTLPANTTTPGHVGFYYNNTQKDSADWWKINYTGSGALTVDLNLEATQCCGNKYTWLYIYKDTNAAPVYSNYTLGTLSASLTGLTQGYYWIRVNMYYSYEFISYTLTPTFTQANVASISITQAINGTCTTGQLQMQGSGSQPPYTVKLYRFGTLYNTYVTNQTGGYTASNLPPGTYYATAFGDGATGTAFGTSNTKNLLPPATTTTSETSITATAATVHYTKVICANGYVVQWRKQGTTTWSQKIVLGNKDSLRITGLTANTAYQWRVAVGVGLDTLTNYVLSAFTAVDQFTTAASFIAAGNNNSDMISANAGAINVSAAPNPAVNSFRILWNDNKQQIVSAKLNDAFGKTVWSISKVQSSSLNNMMVDVTKLSNGMYTLQIIDETGNIKTTKVFVNR